MFRSLTPHVTQVIVHEIDILYAQLRRYIDSMPFALENNYYELYTLH
jgi:hypothetical protein